MGSFFNKGTNAFLKIPGCFGFVKYTSAVNNIDDHVTFNKEPLLSIGLRAVVLREQQVLALKTFGHAGEIFEELVKIDDHISPVYTI